MPRGRRPSRPPSDGEPPYHRSTATTPEARENEVIAAAYDLAEKQIREGTASAQVITHFLRLGSAKERLEREILAEQKKLVVAKTENLEATRQNGELYEKAIEAMREYSGNGDNEDYD